MMTSAELYGRYQQAAREFVAYDLEISDSGLYDDCSVAQIAKLQRLRRACGAWHRAYQIAKYAEERK